MRAAGCAVLVLLSACRTGATFAPPEVRMIALSATIPNLEQLGSWLREIRPQELALVRSVLAKSDQPHWAEYLAAWQ